MAGSLNHIVGVDGRFTMDTIENLGDAHEALEECFAIIYHLTNGDHEKLARICDLVRAPVPKAPMVWDGVTGQYRAM
ncbi:MAG: hypothetical protein HC889_00545 [Synechococcaceae cyanobacterium SM1_2_3]|nr:hypothetical protein [Synechococcaceae cyanobacterium SM1_2_3]